MKPTEIELASQDQKEHFAQYFTPPDIARFMAGLFDRGNGSHCRLLDPGAGIGSLSEAFLDRWIAGDLDFERVELGAFEIDSLLCLSLEQALDKYDQQPGFSADVRNTDFIYAASDWLCGSLFAEKLPKYTHVMLNPPYKKIRSDSKYRAALSRAGIETVNLYTAFVALSLALMDEGGQLVAITPRSFCNGPYYRPFRTYLVERAAIKHMHLFESRSKAFKDDGVLQENLIFLLERAGSQGSVTVSTSTDDTFTDLTLHKYPFETIVFPDDPESFIHVPTSPKLSLIEASPAIKYSLADTGISVSTGPVVDFRVKEHLRAMPDATTAPLLYPGHFSDFGVLWPVVGGKKPNAIAVNAETKKWLYPSGYYCAVRRFSSKEERRRLIASVVDPHEFPDGTLLGFENHLNILHENKAGLPETLAWGLAIFLNTTAADDYFRRFNGHTQVNATDLRLMKYPSRDVLKELGNWAMHQESLTQETIDSKFASLI